MSSDSNEPNDIEREISNSEEEISECDDDTDPAYQITSEDKRCEKFDLEEDGVTTKTKRVNSITFSMSYSIENLQNENPNIKLRFIHLNLES